MVSPDRRDRRFDIESFQQQSKSLKRSDAHCPTRAKNMPRATVERATAKSPDHWTARTQESGR
jgi:hypothetical protein